MGASKNQKKARRHQLPTQDLQPRNGQAVRGGKKAASVVKVTQQQIDASLQEVQGAPQDLPK